MAKLAYLLLAFVVACVIAETLSVSLNDRNDGRMRHLRRMLTKRHRRARGLVMNKRFQFLSDMLDKVPFLKNLIMALLRGLCYIGRYLPFIGPKCEALLGGGAAGSLQVCPPEVPAAETKPQVLEDIEKEKQCQSGAACWTPCTWSPLIGMPVVEADHPGLTDGQCAIRLSYCEDKPVAEADYVSCHSLDLKQPLYTSQYHTKARVFDGEGGDRDSNTFRPDDRLDKEVQLHHDDYTGTDMDRGHMVPNADFGTEEARKCTFRVTNIFHQKNYANRGCWRLMEEFLRDLMEKDVFTKIEMHNSLVYSLPGILDDMLIVKAGKKDKDIAYPYFSYKFVLAIKEASNEAVINICFLHNPDAHAELVGDKLKTPIGLHVDNCLTATSKEHCLSHCVGLDDPRPLFEISQCVESDPSNPNDAALKAITARQLMDLSRLNFNGIVQAAEAKYTVDKVKSLTTYLPE